MNDFHVSVLLKETVECLNVRPGKKYIDATLGGGGHTVEILRHGGKVLGIDVDQDALNYVQEKLRVENGELRIKENLTLAHGNFREIKKIAHLNNFQNVAGIIFDLGVSSYQIDTAERGFSFAKTGPLDMRMDKSLKISAADLVNILTKGELYELFSKLGEERRALAISDNIIRARRVSPIKTTDELALLIEQVYGLRSGVKDDRIKAKLDAKVFQSLRIAVNDELNNIKEALPEALELLESEGRLAVITFHSLEDRIVKNLFRQFEEEEKGKILTKKVIKPGFEEIKKNRRARSAKLRVFEKK